MKIKKILIALFFSSTTYGVFAQNESMTYHFDDEKIHKWGCALTVNSVQGQIAIPLMTGTGLQLVDSDGNVLAGGKRIDKSYSYSVIPKYYINHGFLLRFELGITKLHLQANLDQILPLEHNMSNSEVITQMYKYTPGFQWVFMNKKRIQSYCGMTASYINYQRVYSNQYYESRDKTTNTIQYWNNEKNVTSGGFSIGVGAFAGFSIYLSKSISLGAELSSAAMYYKLGGLTTNEDTEFNVAGPNPSVTYYNTFSNSYKGFKISKILSSFNISVWF